MLPRHLAAPSEARGTSGIACDGTARNWTMSSDQLPADDLTSPERDQELLQIREALRNLKFGSINIFVQDGVVVQIDRTERRRLRQANSK